MIRSLMISIALLSGASLLWGQSSGTANDSLPTLIIFSGSDWCLPCIRLEKQVFSTPEFQDYANRHLKLIRADFPQRTSLPAKMVERNESLAEQYNPQGTFPKLCLLQSPENKPVYLSYDYSEPQALIRDIQNYTTKKIYRRKLILMGSSFEFVLVHENAKIAEQLLDQCVAETRRLEAILSEWQDSSEVSEVNRKAGLAAVVVSKELYDLTTRCVEISRITQGAFDITFRGVNLWEFKGEELEHWPDSALLKKQVSSVGYEKIKLSETNKLMLTEEGMAIGFGAVGKGYAADHLKKMLIDAGVGAGVINASGDLTTWGTRPDGTDWNVGISNPDFPKGLLFGMRLSERSIATSGSYEKYFYYRKKRYAHIIDPKTGIPVHNKKSVSVISNSAELSDALATAFFVLETRIALDLAEQIPGVSCIIINDKDEVLTTADIDLEP